MNSFLKLKKTKMIINAMCDPEWDSGPEKRNGCKGCY